MKINGKTWNEYLASWPDGQWFDDSDETVDGIGPDHPSFPITPPDDSVVEIKCGVIFKGDSDRNGVDLIRHLSAWLKARDNKTLLVTFPNAKEAELMAFLKTIGAKVTA